MRGLARLLADATINDTSEGAHFPAPDPQSVLVHVFAPGPEAEGPAAEIFLDRSGEDPLGAGDPFRRAQHAPGRGQLDR